MVEYVKSLYGLYVDEDQFEGQGLVEYALILVLISVVAIAVMATLGGKVKGVFKTVSDTMNTAPGGGS
ncbi:Flp family type IVb pilin [Sphaerobacter sp.]|uniref:Flp family type IVb pilin n=1 Tax=Sphaerobacter sp. TaxID=2099654 RepID=UPI001DA3315A|nr:Flp family type IVb pilin [Sphaerobacter sp.]MBX5443972.1 Flp family type IVb pilin [Sphaerobacter sp.]